MAPFLFHSTPRLGGVSSLMTRGSTQGGRYRHVVILFPTIPFEEISFPQQSSSVADTRVSKTPECLTATDMLRPCRRNVSVHFRSRDRWSSLRGRGRGWYPAPSLFPGLMAGLPDTEREVQTNPSPPLFHPPPPLLHIMDPLRRRWHSAPKASPHLQACSLAPCGVPSQDEEPQGTASPGQDSLENSETRAEGAWNTTDLSIR